VIGFAHFPVDPAAVNGEDELIDLALQKQKARRRSAALPDRARRP
jgi:hypothetical protein